ncbi:zinc-dependent alcohol dehydrogenase family protein [Mycobacterium sp. CBMA293]|uniref:zinc-dependent alcohol dehydrogenase family protein n=2 Tax=Mycolicibacterium TaxID=1866885 RepID=UPI0012DC6D21|nr:MULTISPECIES: zinc-dependent alcohol dehydrogenase family protein [unclassified Mycolicibacterium]MUL47113.1 zinc-dependent alcohol dehydrogenase family protein [Mycolicibacterium sp. CBMA 360]MUL58490.1 zinc-dependent alcohol dehydrogenase family protein [Mycolicibacterium sp. CBMA 335]MUL73948.1 zinc-dependent alcohol dehydrogenase family protein [Mycolicibacterium sp. CBMA 311]MUL93373.1 zinc-dependent alcohol dehydrogenase family protein [Mycolicibacterium sp. CBMA 230]MUM04588.1 quinon
MRAAVLSAFGSPLCVTDLPDPVRGPGEVLVRIRASGINPLDTKIRRGEAAHAAVVLPAVLGIDMAGTVEAVGPEVTEFTVGDDVYGMTGGVGGLQGSLAELAVVDSRLLAIKPHALTMREAAAVPLAFITAWEGLVDRAQVQSGQRVLIHGGAGGIGHVAVQLALSVGAEVYATGSSASQDFIGALGATPIDYSASTVAEYVSDHTGGDGFDVVFDTVGGSILDDSFTAARRYTGHVVSALGWGSHSLAPLSFRGATYSGVFTLLPLLTGQCREHHGEILWHATKLANSGGLNPRVNPQSFTLDTVGDAYIATESGGRRGKSVVSLE